jgi:hypothetical protein
MNKNKIKTQTDSHDGFRYIIWLLLALLWDSTTAQTLPLVPVTIGQQIQVEGYIIDRFCITRGTFVDTNLPVLENANQHTVHCLIDEPDCLNSPFELLLDPLSLGGPYTRGYTLDETSKTQIIVPLIQKVGICQTCSEFGVLQEGFRVRLTATVLDLGDATTGAGPLIQVTDAFPVLPPLQFDVGSQYASLEGFIMDNYCIQRGTLMDSLSVTTLEQPYLHSVHCLLDVPECIQSNFELLFDPTEGLENIYRRGFVLDEAAKASAVQVAANVSKCDTCTGVGQLERGFRVRLDNVIVRTEADLTAGVPSIISASQVTPVYYYNDASTQVDLKVGDFVTAEGYVMDRACIDNGFLMESPALPTLENPHLHTLRCLLDVAECAQSPYEILLDPVPGSGSTLYTRGFTLDEEGKATVVGIAQYYGNCTTCFGTGDWNQGFRVEIRGRIIATGNDLEPPTVEVESVLPKRQTEKVGVEIAAPAVNGTEMQGNVTEAGCEIQSTFPYVGSHEVEGPEGENLSFSYTIEYDEDINMGSISVRVAYSKFGWVGFGFSESGGMVDSTAVIGRLDQNMSLSNPGIYNLGGKALDSVSLSPNQTLIDARLMSEGNQTVLEFTKLLEEPGHVPVNVSGTNFFLVAAGSVESFYGHSIRGSVEVVLPPCAPEVDTGSLPPECSGGNCTAEVPVPPVLNITDLGTNNTNPPILGRVSVEGFVVDNHCIRLGYLFDNQNISTLAEPNQHSLHCLLDIPECNSSSYEILLDPLPGETLYQRGFTLDEPSKALVAELARSIGTCDTCSGEGRVERGFRVKLEADVLDTGDGSGPPTISVVQLSPVFYITDTSTKVGLRVGDNVALQGKL